MLQFTKTIFAAKNIQDYYFIIFNILKSNKKLSWSFKDIILIIISNSLFLHLGNAKLKPNIFRILWIK